MNEPRLNLVVLRVADLERAERFYAALGLVFQRHAHGNGPEHLAAEWGGMVLELYPATPAQPVTASARIGFLVGELDGLCGKLALVPGAKVVSAPKDSEWGRRAVVADPDGHRVELLERGVAGSAIRA
jgi:lactoylglutathione lyase